MTIELPNVQPDFSALAPNAVLSVFLEEMARKIETEFTERDDAFLIALAKDDMALAEAISQSPQWISALRKKVHDERIDSLKHVDDFMLSSTELTTRLARLQVIFTKKPLLEQFDVQQRETLFEYFFNLEGYSLDSSHRLDDLPDQNQLLFFACRVGLYDRVTTLIQDEEEVNVADLHGKTPLSWAAHRGHFKIVQLLVEHHAKINWQDDEGATPLLEAIRQGFCDIAFFLLEQGANPNEQDINGSTPLKLAASQNQTAVLDALLKHKAEINANHSFGKSPLSLAVSGEHLESVQFLVEKGANLNYKDSDGATPLLHAIQLGNEIIATFLLQAGARADLSDAQGRTPLKAAMNQEKENLVLLLLKYNADVSGAGHAALIWAVKHKNYGLIDRFLEHGADLNGGIQGENALLIAIELGDEALIAYLLEKGANPECLDLKQETPLMRAVRLKKATLIELLLKHGATPDSNQSGTTPLIVAVKENERELVHALLKAGANVDLEDAEGNTALNFAAHFQRMEITQNLINAQANINSENHLGWTALMRAVANKDVSMMMLLLQHGAKIDGSRENFSKTPLSWAVMGDDRESVEFLLKHGAQINAKDGYGKTALMWATADRNPQMAALLLEHGADLNVTDGAGGTALGWAISNDYVSMVEFLLDNGAKIEGTNIEGINVLNWLVENNRETMVNVLLKHAKNSYGGQQHIHPILSAAKLGHVMVIRFFLHRGESIEQIGEHGETPLMCAVKGGHRDAVAYILEQHPNVNALDHKKRSAAHYAATIPDEDIFKRLHQAGIKINQPDSYGKTPLLYAIDKKNKEIIFYLAQWCPTEQVWKTIRLLLQKEDHTGLDYLVQRAFTLQTKLPFWKKFWNASKHFFLRTSVAPHLHRLSFQANELPRIEALHQALQEKDKAGQAVLWMLKRKRNETMVDVIVTSAQKCYVKALMKTQKMLEERKCTFAQLSDSHRAALSYQRDKMKAAFLKEMDIKK